MTNLKAAVFIVLALFAAGCGGGGDGGDGGPANVDISAFPEKLDAGDLTNVKITISDVNEDGIMLKIRTPLGLDYVNDTGYLKVDDVLINLDPDFYQADSKFNYLVYFLPRNYFGESNYGELTVQYQGSGAIPAGTIDVDADLDNPAVSHGKQFTVSAPNFTAVDKQKIVVSN